MAKPPSSAIGIDVGRHSMKAVLLKRRGTRLALTHFAVREFPEEINTLEGLGENLKPLLHDLGGSAKGVGIAVSHPEAMVRIIEQNTIPPELLRDALRINGPLLLSQDCREWVIDCAAIPVGAAGAPSAEGQQQVRYLVGGLPRAHVQKIHEACGKNKIASTVLQLPPVALLNAFEFANEEIFKTQAFVLVDIGHRSSTVIVGVKGELILIRSVEYGGAHFAEHLILQGAANFEEVVGMLEEDEVLTVENARLSLNELVRSISSSIGFFEAQHEEAIPKVYISGGLAKLPKILSLLVEELRLPCETWDPFADCELSIPRMRVGALTEQLPLLGSAFGVAAEIMRSCLKIRRGCARGGNGV
ncbi:MAG: pilus assembly protein PilM [Verrucomicrobia bacterium]|nr:pilus assembly protein PilM [Verrucomicrobiota bacterium]